MAVRAMPSDAGLLVGAVVEALPQRPAPPADAIHLMRASEREVVSPWR